jgi:anti-anti-sigma factor
MAFALSQTTVGDRVAVISLEGELDATVAGQLRDAVDQAASVGQARRLVLDMTDLTFMASAGLRALVFARQKMGPNVEIFVVGAQESVLETIEMTGFQHSVTLLDTYDAAQIES